MSPMPHPISEQLTQAIANQDEHSDLIVGVVVTPAQYDSLVGRPPLPAGAPTGRTWPDTKFAGLPVTADHLALTGWLMLQSGDRKLLQPTD